MRRKDSPWLGTILRTTDGGATWTLQSSGNALLNGVSFTDADTGTAVGFAGTILRTTNRGLDAPVQPDYELALVCLLHQHQHGHGGGR